LIGTDYETPPGAAKENKQPLDAINYISLLGK
jgi:hypothetical protein